MKKLVLVLASAAIAHTGFSQITIDPEVGVGFSNIKSQVKDNDATYSDFKTGFNAGVGVNIDLKNGLYVKPAVHYSLLGGQDETMGITSKLNLHYLRVPVNIGYSIPISSKAGSIFAEAGPYIGYAIAGDLDINDIKTDIDFGTEISERNPLDWGFNFGLGYETPWGVFVKGTYGLGLGNQSNIDDFKETNGAWNVGVGYRIKL